MQKFALIGSGRVASHLAPALVHGGLNCTGIWSRTLSHARELAEASQTEAVEDLETFIAHTLSTGAEALLISVSDDAIPGIVDALPPDFPIPVIHTSGSTPLDVLSPIPYQGVLYPMQTFSREREIDFAQVPLFLEHNSSEAEVVLKELAHTLGSQSVQTITSQERVRLHLAAVFGCNFVNHLYALSAKVLEDTSISFDVLTPLLRETLEKALKNDPKSFQTGPASRHDDKTITRHLDLLEKEEPELVEIYSLLTKSIQHLSNQ